MAEATPSDEPKVKKQKQVVYGPFTAGTAHQSKRSTHQANRKGRQGVKASQACNAAQANEVCVMFPTLTSLAARTALLCHSETLLNLPWPGSL